MSRYTTIKNYPQTTEVDGKTHESIFRSYQILREVTAMLHRGDSQDSVLNFIYFAQGKDEK